MVSFYPIGVPLMVPDGPVANGHEEGRQPRGKYFNELSICQSKSLVVSIIGVSRLFPVALVDQRGGGEDANAR